jgi:hypothetical protein
LRAFAWRAGQLGHTAARTVRPTATLKFHRRCPPFDIAVFICVRY